MKLEIYYSGGFPDGGLLICGSRACTCSDHRRSAFSGINKYHADVRARGFWTQAQAQNAFFDVRVFHPDVASYKSKPISDLLKQHQRREKSEYGERINNVDRGSFTIVWIAGNCRSTVCPANGLCAVSLVLRFAQGSDNVHSQVTFGLPSPS